MLIYLTDGDTVWQSQTVADLGELALLNHQADVVTHGRLWWVTFAEWLNMRRAARQQEGECTSWKHWQHC